METLLKDSLKKSVRWGDVWIVRELKETYKGVIKGESRLVIIVANPIACNKSYLLQYVPLTKLENKEECNQPTQVIFYKNIDIETKINVDSVALCEQENIIHRDELKWRIGKIPANRINDLIEALAIQNNIPTYKFVMNEVERYISNLEQIDRYLNTNQDEITLKERHSLYKSFEAFVKMHEVKIDIEKYSMYRGEDNAETV